MLKLQSQYSHFNLRIDLTGAESQPFPPFKDSALLLHPLEAFVAPLPLLEELLCPEILTPTLFLPGISNSGLAFDYLEVEEI